MMMLDELLLFFTLIRAELHVVALTHLGGGGVGIVSLLFKFTQEFPNVVSHWN